MKNKSIDSLSQDILDHNFVKVFQPVHCIQSWLGFIRVNIKHKFVTPPSPFSQIYSCILRGLTFLLSIYCVINCETILHFSIVTELFLYTGFLLNQVTNSIVAWQNNFHQGKLNSQLYVKLQKIDRGLISSKTRLNQRLSYRTLIITVVLFSLCLIWNLSYAFLIPTTFCPAVNVYMLLSMGIYSEGILSIIIVYYIGIRIEYINKVLAKETNSCDLVIKKCDYVWMVGDTVPNIGVSNQLVCSLHYLLDVIGDWLKLYEFPIFCFMSHVLVIDLIVMQSLVTVLKGQMGDYRVPLYLSPLFLFMVCQIILCFLSSAVSSKLEKMRTLCNRVLQYHITGKSRENAVRMIILLDAKRNMSIYGVLTLSSRLPLSFLGIIASYTIVLFQFALL